jgi:5-methylcytosine-specific restriction enzyme subunit McrC
MKQVHHISEYGVIRCVTDYPEGESAFNEIYLPEKSFNNLYKYILESQSAYLDKDLPFVLYSKSGKRQIKVKNYVGVIETRDGLYLEILPKIFLNKTKDEITTTKSIFLKMLRHLKESPFININSAHLNAKQNFPILEVFISAYIEQVELIFKSGIKSEYIIEDDNLPYVKGKLNIRKNVKYNYINKSHFHCEYSEFSSNIPPNRIIKSTIKKLLNHTNSQYNYKQLNKVLQRLELVDCSVSIYRDLDNCNVNNRKFKTYETAIKWSEIFLKNRGFTNFQGDYINMAVLYPMEKIFESYIGYLFIRYASGYKIKAQDKSYFLVDRHIDKGKFTLKPDYFLQRDVRDKYIIDTKWKLLNENDVNRNYGIAQSDMYQLYAYGKKYTGAVIPKLIMMYPSSSTFTKKLPSFIYEGELELEVIPFDFLKDEESQIKSIVN